MSDVPDHDKPLLPKPAFLKRVRIRNYKSIAFCDVKLEPLTIFVGRNGTGKSNFLDALGFLADLMNKSVYEAVHSRGGWNAISSAFRTSDTISIEVELCIEDEPDQNLNAEYAIDITKQADDTICITREHLSISKVKSAQEIGFTWNGKVLSLTRDLEVSESIDKPNGQFWRWFSTGSGEKANLQVVSSISQIGGVYDRLKSSGTFNFQPAVIRQIQPIAGPWLLANDGRNLPDLLLRLELHDQDWYARMMRYLHFIVPSVANAKQLVLSGAGGPNASFQTITFDVEIRPGRTIPFYASNVSDGTLRVLASLAAVYQHVSGWKPAGFIGIEEPETAIHPAALQGLIAAFDEATLSTQILLTTHSPDLLDCEEVKPENIRIVDMVEGRTMISELGSLGKKLVAQHLTSLGDLQREHNLIGDTVEQTEESPAIDEVTV
jgi:predicted ATPase